jgi:hypothetical protein
VRPPQVDHINSMRRVALDVFHGSWSDRHGPLNDELAPGSISEEQFLGVVGLLVTRDFVFNVEGQDQTVRHSPGPGLAARPAHRHCGWQWLRDVPSRARHSDVPRQAGNLYSRPGFGPCLTSYIWLQFMLPALDILNNAEPHLANAERKNNDTHVSVLATRTVAKGEEVSRPLQRDGLKQAGYKGREHPIPAGTQGGLGLLPWLDHHCILS